MEIMRKDLNDARDLHGQAESAAAVWKASGVGLGRTQGGDVGVGPDPDRWGCGWVLHTAANPPPRGG